MRCNRFYNVFCTEIDNPFNEKAFAVRRVKVNGQIVPPKDWKAALEEFKSSSTAKEWTPFMVQTLEERFID